MYIKINKFYYTKFEHFLSGSPSYKTKAQSGGHIFYWAAYL